MRVCQRGRSLRRAASAMTGLQVAPTAPQPIAADSSAGVAESFHSRVGVSRAMRSSGGAAPPCPLGGALGAARPGLLPPGGPGPPRPGRRAPPAARRRAARVALLPSGGAGPRRRGGGRARGRGAVGGGSVVPPGGGAAGGLRGLAAAGVRRGGPKQPAERLVAVVDRRDQLEAHPPAVVD